MRNRKRVQLAQKREAAKKDKKWLAKRKFN